MKKFLLCAFLIAGTLYGQQPDPLRTKDAEKQQRWVDSIYAKMTIDQKIGQLFMVQVFSSQQNRTHETIKQLVEKYHIGGIIFSKGGPKRQAKLTNEYQKLSKTPLFIAMDAEWGLAMRIDSTYAFPWNMTLGAVKNNTLIEQTGYRIAKHCQRLGVHIDFSPSVDINTNPENPIIGNRSFGEDKYNVSQKGIAYAKGMQSVGVLANAKHFPGHGDTSQDSHLTLPTIDFSKERIENVELYPFKELISNGVASVMVGHLNIPSLEKNKKPSSLSYDIVTRLLKEKLGFNGLIFTDALGMKGIADHYKAGDADLEAFLAGNDVLLMSTDVQKGISKLKEAYKSGIITEQRLSHSVKKILKGKYWAGLNAYKPINLVNLLEDLNTKEDELLTDRIYEEAITIAKNSKETLPLKKLDSQRTAYLKMGDDSGWEFYKNLRLYDDVKEIKGMWAELSKEIENYDRIIIGLHRSNANPWAAFKFTASEKEVLGKIAAKKPVILTLFVRPYALLDLPTTSNLSSVVVAYQNSPAAQRKAAQIIYGAVEGKGVLPVSAHKELPVNISVQTPNIGRLQYGLPESVAMDSRVLAKIDSVVQYAIEQKMTPSAQILVARAGRVVYNKSFGHFTYEKKQMVTTDNLYDLASLTKILASLPELMQYYDQKKISASTTLGTLLPELKGTNKENITLAECLSHYGQLQSWIPFYTKTIDAKTKKPVSAVYQTTFSKNYPTQVADNLFIAKGYADTIFNAIAQSDLIKRKRYWYSDLPYYLFQRYIEKQEKKPLNEIVANNFYKGMGAYRLTYLPLKSFDKNEILPTEQDNYFRYQKIQGHVHDQGAAMLGGVGGHAGLFGNANDVAKMMQLYLQKGYYGGVRYFSENTFEIFNATHFSENQNRRGLGFDKPQPKGEEGPTCDCVSSNSFGHSGFTGTYAWADPDSQIVYIFLSNRTFPDSENKKLIKENIRTTIQRIIQQAIIG